MEENAYRFAGVKIRCDNSVISIPITSESKPRITPPIKEKWLKVIEIVSKCMNVPAALIMEIDENEISVLVSSRNTDNPYSPGGKEELKKGLYCETVLGKDAPLYIPDAMDNSWWCDNPDIKLGMTSYLGFPLKWPDGEFFGTICVLDSIDNPYMQSFADLLLLGRDIIEKDLADIYNNYTDSDNQLSELQKKIEVLNCTRNRLTVSVFEKSNFLEKFYSGVKKNIAAVNDMLLRKTTNRPLDEIAALLMDARTRFGSVSCLLDTIYQYKNAGAIPVKPYICELSDRIRETYNTDESNIMIGVDIPDYITLNIHEAVSCGLIVNEAVINSVKHAFSGKMHGEVLIMMREIGREEYMLQISDNGCGMKNKGMSEKAAGSGVELIYTLVSGMSGLLSILSDNGTAYIIDFKNRAGLHNSDYNSC